MNKCFFFDFVMIYKMLFNVERIVPIFDKRKLLSYFLTVAGLYEVLFV